MAGYKRVYRVYPHGLEHLWCTRYWWKGGMTTEAYDPRSRRVILSLVCPGCTTYDLNTPMWKEMEALFIKKSLERAKQVKSNDKCADTAWVKHFPAVAEFMTTTVLDGEPRQTATLSFWWTPQGFTCVLNDRETGQSLFASADRFDGLLEALEAALKSPDPGWRAKDDNGRSKRVKRT